MKTGYQNHRFDAIQFGSFPSVNPSVISKPNQPIIDDSPLCTACSQGKIELVKQLVEEGFDVNQKDSTNSAPIVKAAINGHRNIVEFLVKKGARISYTLLCSVKAKIDVLEENTKAGLEDSYSVIKWKTFLDYLILEGKKQ